MPTYTQTEPQAPKITAGKHRIEIIGAETKIAKSGNEYFRLKLQVKLQDGSDGGTIYDNMVFSPKSAWKCDQIREALGFAVVPNEPVSVEAEDLLGKSAVVLVKFNDETGYHEVDRWVSPKEAVEASAAPKAAKVQVDADGDEIPF